MTLQALSLVEMAEPVQVRYFTLRLRDRRSIYVNARWMSSLHGFVHGIEWIMVHGHLDCSQKSFVGGRPNTNLGDHDTPNAHNCWFILFYYVQEPAWMGISLKEHLVEGLVTYGFTIHLKIRDHARWCWRCVRDGHWTLSAGLSHFHSHGSWLMCEMVLSSGGGNSPEKESWHWLSEWGHLLSRNAKVACVKWWALHRR